MIGLHCDFHPMVNAPIRLSHGEPRKVSALALMQDAPDEIRRIIRGFDVPKSKHNFQRMNERSTYGENACLNRNGLKLLSLAAGLAANS